MKKIFQCMAFAMGALLMLAACGENDVYISGDNPGGSGGSENVPANMADYNISGIVTGTDGKAIEGVSVVSGKASATTNVSGFFTLDRSNVQYDHIVIKFEKPGYFPVTKSFDIMGEGNDICKVVMVPKGSSSNSTTVKFNSGQGRKVDVGGLTIDFPANGFKRQSDGSRYSGPVNVDVLHLSPDSEQFYEMMPGDLTALDADNQYKALVSYGMANVIMTDDAGNALQLADGSEATVTFKVPASMKNGPAEIPLWSFSDGYGLWKQEKTAVRQPDGTYVGKASHFSWLNLDEDYDKATLMGQVITTEGTPMKHVCVTINNLFHVYTNENGCFRKTVQSNVAFPVTVCSADYGNHTEVTVFVDPIPAGGTKYITIEVPVTHRVYGRITDSDYTPVQTLYSVELFRNGTIYQSTYDLINGADGTYEYYLPEDFTGEGKITAYAPDGKVVEKEFTVPSNSDVEVNIIVSSGSSGGGNLDITAECPGEDIHMLSVTRPGVTTFGGVMIEDDRLMVMTGDDDEDYSDKGNQLLVYVDGYSPDKEEYDNATVQAQDGMKAVMSPSGKLKVTRDGDLFYFTFEGTGYYRNTASGDYEWKEGIIRVHNVDIMHLFTAQTRINYVPVSPIPSFCPRLSAPAPVATLITESKKLGTGGMLYYNGTKNDFASLCSQASKTGLKKIMCEYDDYEGEAAYEGTKKFVMMEYYRDGEEIDAAAALRDGVLVPRRLGEGEEDYEIDAQITVTAFQNGAFSISDLMGDDDDYSAAAYTSSLIRRNAKSARALARKAMKRR